MHRQTESEYNQDEPRPRFVQPEPGLFAQTGDGAPLLTDLSELSKLTTPTQPLWALATQEITRLSNRIQSLSLEAVAALANAIEARDLYTRGHSDRVSLHSRRIGEALGIEGDELQLLAWAGLLHDVGKIGTPERILNKRGRLTEDEFAQIKQHPVLGHKMLSPVSGLRSVLDAVLYHHENYDGSGYPEGLAGDEIPMFARIVHVADVFDALTSTRSYRKRLSVDTALGVLERESGRATDPHITSVFLGLIRVDQDQAAVNPAVASASLPHTDSSAIPSIP